MVMEIQHVTQFEFQRVTMHVCMVNKMVNVDDSMNSTRPKWAPSCPGVIVRMKDTTRSSYRKTQGLETLRAGLMVPHFSHMVKMT